MHGSTLTRLAVNPLRRYQTVYYADGCGPGLKVLTSPASMDEAHHERRVYVKGNSGRTGAEQHQDVKSQYVCKPPSLINVDC